MLQVIYLSLVAPIIVGVVLAEFSAWLKKRK